MKKSVAFFALVFFSLLLMPDAVFAQRGGRSQEEPLRFASPLPKNSPWGRSMDRVAAEWAKATNNEVRLRVIHDGAEGGDAKMLSSLSANNIQAALFSTFALSQICPAVMTLSVPFLIRNDAEFDVALQESKAFLEAQIQKNNFVVIAWSKGGWVNLFSKDPVFSPGDLRQSRIRVATSPESKEMNMAFSLMGFNLVDTDGLELGTRLANGTINAFYQTPAAVAPLGLHRSMGHMLGMPLAPYLGAIVMNRVTWDKLGAERQRMLVKITQDIANEFDSTMPKMTQDALTMMQREKLQVHMLTPSQEAVWQTELEKVMPSLLGITYDRELYQRIAGALDRYRNGR